MEVLDIYTLSELVKSQFHLEICAGLLRTVPNGQERLNGPNCLSLPRPILPFRRCRRCRINHYEQHWMFFDRIHSFKQPLTRTQNA